MKRVRVNILTCTVCRKSLAALHVCVKYVVYLVLGIGTQDSDCANSADPDEMPPYVAFHLGWHCLPKYIFTGIQNE